MTRIVFVNPLLSIQDRYGLKSQGGAETPPLGLACLPAMTRKHGYDTAVIDAAAANMSCEEITREILERGFKYVGITAATISVGNAGRVAELIKAAYKGITTIIGGPHLSALPEETMSRYPSFDIGVIGEGDYTTIDLLEHLETWKELTLSRG
jgi:anaerobic magnesium-protoporphyrin IX monomethyl ester cyclase